MSNQRGSKKYFNESRHTCPVADCIWEELNITNACDCKQATKHHKGISGICLFTSIGKDQIANYARSLGINCMSLADKNLDSFSSANLINNGCCNCMLL